MAIAFFITVVLGLIAILLSLENDKLRKLGALERKSKDDKIKRLSALKELQGKIAYTSDSEKVVDTIMANIRNFFPYSTASSIVIKEDSLIFTTYMQEEVSNEYIKNIEKSMLSSLSELLGKLPEKIDRRFYGVTLNNSIKISHSSSFHVPLIIKNKVHALVHLSSTKANLYKDTDMEAMYQLIETAATSLSHFNQVLDTERDRFVSLIESIRDGIFTADNRNHLLSINDSAKKILGLNQDNINLFDIINLFSDTLNLGSKINDVSISKKFFAAKEVQINNKVLDIFISPIKDDNVSVVLHDVTEYKKREISKEDLTHIMVHELRAPITTIKDSAELIISTKDLEEDKKLKFLEIINQQAKKILDQIGSILDIAKLDAGKLVLQKTKGNIRKTIDNEVQTFIPQAERKNISLILNVLNNNIPETEFDSIKITEVIDNLLSNSLKFTPVGGKINVDLDYKVIPPTLDESSPMKDFLSLDKYIIVSISDNGVGISKEQQKNLFSKYTQAKNSSQELSKLGTGLGLYVVKGIIEAHGGRIWVASTPGQGTTIYFTLPSKDTSKETFEEPSKSYMTTIN